MKKEPKNLYQMSGAFEFSHSMSYKALANTSFLFNLSNLSIRTDKEFRIKAEVV